MNFAVFLCIYAGNRDGEKFVPFGSVQLRGPTNWTRVDRRFNEKTIMSFSLLFCIVKCIMTLCNSSGNIFSQAKLNWTELNIVVCIEVLFVWKWNPFSRLNRMLSSLFSTCKSKLIYHHRLVDLSSLEIRKE